MYLGRQFHYLIHLAVWKFFFLIIQLHFSCFIFLVFYLTILNHTFLYYFDSLGFILIKSHSQNQEKAFLVLMLFLHESALPFPFLIALV